VNIVEPVDVRQLERGDMLRIARLTAAVRADVPQGYLRDKPQDELLGYLNGTRGVAFGVIEAENLVAMALLKIPSEPYPNDISDPFPFIEPEHWRVGTAMLEYAMVLPSARGRGLQRRLMQARLNQAAAAHMQWACTGMVFRNTVSFTNALRCGMTIVGTRVNGNVPVIGLLKPLTALVSEQLRTDANDELHVSMQDFAQHVAALNRGYLGIGVTRAGVVRYQRRVA
jgi:GNAT superfamily N-acetyltransferase